MIEHAQAKILSSADVKRIVDGYKKHAIPTCLVTGCFDVHHVGHNRLIEFAYFKTGGIVIVGMNDDQAVAALKGPSRPVNPFEHRAEVIAGLIWVRAVFPISTTTVERVISYISPSFWCKGAGYTIDTLNQDEVRAACDVGCEILFAPQVEGVSSTKIIERMKQ